VEDFLAAAREATNWAAMTVFERLGLDFYRDDAGVIRQVLQAFPGATVENTGDTATNVSDEPPYTEEQIKALSGDDAKEAKRAVKEWGQERFDANPNEFFDNRATKTGRQPDYRHKKFGHVVLWVD
jgi:hypothetical protein